MKYLIFLILLTGCATQKKAEKYYAKNPAEFAEKCIEKFPIDTLVNTDTIYAENNAENIDYTNEIDTLFMLSHDTTKIYEIRDRIVDLKVKYTPCKPDTLRINTKYTVEDKKKLFIVQNDLSQEKKAHDKDVWWKKFFMWWAIVATAFLIIKLISIKL